MVLKIFSSATYQVHSLIWGISFVADSDQGTGNCKERQCAKLKIIFPGLFPGSHTKLEVSQDPILITKSNTEATININHTNRFNEFEPDNIDQSNRFGKKPVKHIRRNWFCWVFKTLSPALFVNRY